MDCIRVKVKHLIIRDLVLEPVFQLGRSEAPDHQGQKPGVSFIEVLLLAMFIDCGGSEQRDAQVLFHELQSVMKCVFFK